MAYTNVWDDTQPTGAEAANTIDDIFRSVKVDIEQRFIDLFNMANFTADPLRAGGLKFYDTADAKFILGDNGGFPRSILLRNKADSVTYANWTWSGLTLTPANLTGASTPFFSVTQTWNNAATTFVGMLINVTSTASQTTSKIFDFQVASTSRLNLDRTGLITFSNAIVSTTGLAGPVVVAGVQALFYCTAADGAVLNGNGATTDLSLQARGTVVLKVNAGTTTVIVNSGLTVAAGTTATVALNASSSFAVASTARLYLDGITASGDTFIYESSANIMGLVCGGTTSLSLTATTAQFGSLALGGITTLTCGTITSTVTGANAVIANRTDAGAITNIVIQQNGINRGFIGSDGTNLSIYGPTNLNGFTIASSGLVTFTNGITGNGVIRNDAASGGFAMGVVTSVPRITYSSVTTAFNFLTGGNGDATLLTGHLYAETDAVFDIGQSSSLLRYRDLFISRNATIGGGITCGAIAASGSISGLGTSGVGRINATSNGAVANGGTLDLATNGSGGTFAGILVVVSNDINNAGNSTRTVYAVTGRGTSATFAVVSSTNGATAGWAFTMSVPSNGTLRATNNGGGTANMELTFFGTDGG